LGDGSLYWKGQLLKTIQETIFNLGEISEDVLKDGRKQYENGLGPDQILVNPRPIWGDVPASQSLIYAFDTNANNRSNQDVGLDGLSDANEGQCILISRLKLIQLLMIIAFT
jgi:cell surface protein SprA